MIRQITDISGNLVKVECIGCAIVQGTLEVRGGSVISSKYFDVSQDFEVPIPGFMIVATKRHLSSIDELTNEEAAEFTQILRATRKLQREILGIESVYIHQEEDSSDHFHIWMMPRYEWMGQFGHKVESMRPVMDYAKARLKTEENLAKLDEDIKRLRAAASELQF